MHDSDVSIPPLKNVDTAIDAPGWLEKRMKEIEKAIASRDCADTFWVYKNLKYAGENMDLRNQLPPVHPDYRSPFNDTSTQSIRNFTTALKAIEENIIPASENRSKDNPIGFLDERKAEGKRILTALEVLFNILDVYSKKRQQEEQEKQQREVAKAQHRQQYSLPTPTSLSVSPVSGTPPEQQLNRVQNEKQELVREQEELIQENESLLRLLFDHFNGFESFLQTTNPTQYQKWRAFRREFEMREVDAAWTKRFLDELPSISLTLQSIVEARTTLAVAHKALMQSRQNADLGWEELQKKLDEAMAEQTRLSAVVTRLDQQRNEAESKVRNLEQQLTLEQGNQETLTARIREALSKVDKLQKDRDDALETQSLFEQKINTLQQELAVERGLNTEVRQHLEQVEQRNKDSHRELQEIVNQWQEQTISDLATKVKLLPELAETLFYIDQVRKHLNDTSWLTATINLDQIERAAYRSPMPSFIQAVRNVPGERLQDEILIPLVALAREQSHLQGELLGVGIYPIAPCPGDKFDSRRHFASREHLVPVTDPAQDNKVSNLIQMGFERDGKILRHAVVNRYVFGSSYRTTDSAETPGIPPSPIVDTAQAMEPGPTTKPARSTRRSVSNEPTESVSDENKVSPAESQEVPTTEVDTTEPLSANSDETMTIAPIRPSRRGGGGYFQTANDENGVG